MSKILFSTVGSLGDLNPYLAIAKEIYALGHEAIIATSEDYRSTVTDAGIDFYAVPPVIADHGDYGKLVNRLLDVKNGPKFLIKQMIMPYLYASYNALLRASNDVDLLVSHPLAITLPLVSEKTKIPWVSTVLAPLSLMSCTDPPLIANVPWLRHIRIFGPTIYRFAFSIVKFFLADWEKPLKSFRNEIGLNKSFKMSFLDGQFSPLKNLALFDSILADKQPDWPTNTFIYGAPLYEPHSAKNSLPKELEKFLQEGEPPIIFALGSVVTWISKEFWKSAIKACLMLDKRAILVTGPMKLENLPNNVIAFPYLPYSKLFLKGEIIVHQAGIGTLAYALRSGCPQLMVPNSYDQPDNARRAKSLGVGDAIPFSKVTAENLESKLKLLLKNVEYKKKALSILDKLDTNNGSHNAAKSLINILNTM